MNETKIPTDFMEQIRSAYPKRLGGQGWGFVRKKIPQLISQGHTFEDLLDGAKRYAALMDATGTTRTPFVMQARTFFGPGEWWLEDYELPRDGSVELTLDQEAEGYGIERQEGESDESLKKRLGVAMTRKQYG